jgi:hypothetical protein
MAAVPSLEIVYYVAASLDGFIATADGGITGGSRSNIVSVIPVLLGSGIPLFDGPARAENLRLLGSKTYESGIVQLRYLRVGA